MVSPWRMRSLAACSPCQSVRNSITTNSKPALMTIQSPGNGLGQVFQPDMLFLWHYFLWPLQASAHFCADKNLALRINHHVVGDPHHLCGLGFISRFRDENWLSLIHISEPTRRTPIS